MLFLVLLLGSGLGHDLGGCICGRKRHGRTALSRHRSGSPVCPKVPGKRRVLSSSPSPVSGAEGFRRPPTSGDSRGGGSGWGCGWTRREEQGRGGSRTAPHSLVPRTPRPASRGPDFPPRGRVVELHSCDLTSFWRPPGLSKPDGRSLPRFPEL